MSDEREPQPNLRKEARDLRDEEERKLTGRSWAHTAQVIAVTAIIFAFLAYLASLDQLV
jgi:hypothetical protein